MNDNVLDGMSMNLEAEAKERLKSVFPDCFSEGKLDIDKLLSLCGEYIDEDYEKYKFEWKGKSECLRLAQKRSTGTLRPCRSESANFDTTNNLYIEGDNLEVLKLLQTAYFRRVKMIYIDPPYNTGNDFVYEDDFKDPLARYKEVTEQTTKSNPETMGRFHTNWLNMMYPRLRLAANLLRDDGVCFISIDDNEVHNLRKLCDEVFGEENFVSQLGWQKVYAPKNQARYFSNDYEFILCYSKSLNDFTMAELPRTPEMNARYKNPDNDARGDWKAGDCVGNGERKNGYYDVIGPTGKVFNVPQGKHWVYAPDTMAKMIEDNRIWFGKNGDSFPAVKQFLTEVGGRKASNFLSHTDYGHTDMAMKDLKKLFAEIDKPPFDTPKPVKLIEMLLRLETSDTDIILDFFSGSATTAHAVMQLNAEDGGNRQFIMVQLPELCDEKSEAYKAGYKNICEIGKERIRRAGKQMAENLKREQFTKKGKMALRRSPKEGSLYDDEGNAPNPDIMENPIMVETIDTWGRLRSDEEYNEKVQNLDLGFKVFKLDTSNLNTWDGTPISEENVQLLLDRLNNMTDRVKPDRTDYDMIYEVMLKMGVPLTFPVIPLEVDGIQAYSIGEDAMLIICLAPSISSEDVERLADYAPAKLILSKSSLADDTAMSNAYYILKDRGIELKLV